MVDNIVRAAERFRPSPERLNEAQAAYDQLRIDAKVAVSDRPILAANLGKMLERVRSEKPRGAVKEVFQLAFGNTWESAYKKRGRYLVFRDEIDGTRKGEEVFHATGRAYLDIAHTIQGLAGEEGTEGTRRGVLNLIEGTSLDVRAVHKLREQDHGRMEFRSAIQGVLDRLLTTVDLQRYIELLSKAPMKLVVAEDGKQVLGPAEAASGSIVDRIESTWKLNEAMSRFHEGITEVGLHQLFSEADEDERSGPGWAAPRVLLGYVLQEAPPYGHVDLGICYDDVLNTAIKEVGTVNDDRQTEYDKSLNYKMSDIIMRFVEQKFKTDVLEDYESGEWTLYDHEDYNHQRFRFRLLRPVYLLFQIEISTGRPRLGLECSDGFPTQHGVAPARNIAGLRSFANFNLLGDQWTWSVESDRGNIILVHLNEIDNDHYDLEEPFINHMIRMLPQENAIRMSLARFSQDEGRSFLPEVDYKTSWYAPVARDTLAHVILGNLAYAEESRRIDNLLIADASSRLDAVETYVRSLQATYAQGITR